MLGCLIFSFFLLICCGIFIQLLVFCYMHMVIFVTIFWCHDGNGWILISVFLLLQRVNQCLRDACNSTSLAPNCSSLIDCGRGISIEQIDQNRKNWSNDLYSNDCFNKDGHFQYGIYQQAVLLTTNNSIVKRYIYSLFWGFQVLHSVYLSSK